MPVWLGKPKTMHVAFAAVLDKRPPFTVTVKQPFLFGEIPLGERRCTSAGCVLPPRVHQCAGVATFDLNPAQLGKLDITVSASASSRSSAVPVSQVRLGQWMRHPDHPPARLGASLAGPLHLDSAIDGDLDRAWYARDSLPDYGIIMDAVTDALRAGEDHLAVRESHGRRRHDRTLRLQLPATAAVAPRQRGRRASGRPVAAGAARDDGAAASMSPWPSDDRSGHGGGEQRLSREGSRLAPSP